MEEHSIVSLLQEMVQLLAIQVKRGVTQQQLIHELAEAGIKPKRIATIIGTTANNVSVVLYQKKTKKPSKKKMPKK